MKLSIITINFNDKTGLEKTIKSVIDQTFENFEYLVIDGGSTDGSVDVIKNNAEKISYWVSEPDKGIYNAMNKGIAKATGEYCLFLNSGDYLIDRKVLQKVFENNYREDILYGDLRYQAESGQFSETIFPEKITFSQFISSFLPHPCTFIKKKCFDIAGVYDEKYTIVADWAFMAKAVGKHNCTTRHIPLFVSCHMLGGISSDPQHKKKNFNQREDFLRSEFPAFYEDYIELQRSRLCPNPGGHGSDSVRKELNAVYASREWKAALKLQKLVKTLIPNGSRRRKIAVKTWSFARGKSPAPSKSAENNSAKTKKSLKKRFADWYVEKKVLPRIKKYSEEALKKDKMESILAINTIAGYGGAARAAYDMLAANFRSMGFDSRILCDQAKVTDDGNVISLKKSNKAITRILNKYGYLDLGHDGRKIKEMDCFKKADIVHLHNLHGEHGGYFNPAFLPELTALKPTIWTLHDEQAITGHCAIPLDCAKWEKGCKDCPHLESYPSLECDKSNYLWNLKKKIYDNSDFIVVTPSNWLKKKVEKSILKNKDIRCIHNGIDENIWKPYDKKKARKELNLPPDKKILLFLSEGTIYNLSKGGEFVLNAVEHFKDREDVMFLIVGSELELNCENVITRGYIYDKNELAKYYSSADLFVFPTLSETFGFVTAEAMACGTPVISFDYSATPELVEHMQSGYLAKYKDRDDFISGISLFLDDEGLRERASASARKRFLEKFTLKKCLENYLNLYNEIWEKRKENH
jgi:glycosyltransferase involved in cell wall biosynthesis